jgi:hypothetical protein
MLSLPVAAVLAALTGILLEVVVHLVTGRSGAPFGPHQMS